MRRHSVREGNSVRHRIARSSPGNCAGVAHAQFGGIFSAILSTITGPIGGALTYINRIRREVLQTEQQVFWPLSLIHQAQNYIATIKASYRGWMNNVFALRVNSAVLTDSEESRVGFFQRPANADRKFQPDLYQHLWICSRRPEQRPR